MVWHPVTTAPSQLGESPFWQASDARLYWVDITGCALLRLRPGHAPATPERWALPEEPGCAAPAARGGWVLALRSGIYRARHWGGTLTRIATLPYDLRTQRANDGKCDALGRLWVGTVHEPAPGAERAPVAGLYCIDARHGPAQVRHVLGGVRTANGLAWSPDGATTYFADTPSHRIHAWLGDAPAHGLEGARVLQRFAAKPPGWHSGLLRDGEGGVGGADGAGYGGRPDGACVDAEGAYWCALYEGARVLRIAPTGEVLAELPVPLACPTMPCLGGADGRTLFVTSARAGRSAHELARWPLSGQVLATRVAVPGLPVHAFAEGG